MSSCCPCDELRHPPKPVIPAGLPALPRQLAGFPEFRLAMLRDIREHAPLANWRAREGADLGLMLLEMWAYVLDIVGFYDERIANESYLRTAVLRPSVRKLAGLIGYRPRPALGASVVLAAIAGGDRAVALPRGTAFRSDAFEGEPPQVFETDTTFLIHRLLNEWTLAPVRDTLAGTELVLEPGTAALANGRLALVRWPGELRAGRVAGARPFTAPDGARYVKVEIDPPPVLDPLVELTAFEVLSPTLTTALNLSASTPAAETRLVLDSVHPQIGEGDPVIVQFGNLFHGSLVNGVGRQDVPVSTATGAASLPSTVITLSRPLPVGWSVSPARITVHFQFNESGRRTRPAKTRLDAGDFGPAGAPVQDPAERPPEPVAMPGKLLLQDSAGNGVFVGGAVEIPDDGRARIRLAADTAPFEPTLRTPVTVFGNVVRATRGESVFNEVLGSGAAGQAFQSFTLKKKPLTYFNDASGRDGRRSTIEVRVNGILWSEVASFFGAAPEDEIYSVRQNDDAETVITFGDGVTGARLPTGVDNVTATYRFGAGAAKPPAGAIGQLAKPVEGLRRVVNPVAAGGGADADAPKDIRRNAPASALTLGRAVSLQDFEALAREFGGVINAQADWAWDNRSQNAVVKVWFIPDGGDIAADLRSFLLNQAHPDTPLIVERAAAQPSELVIDLEIDRRFQAQAVMDEIRQILVNPETGILALENIPIGGPLFRSRIFEAVLSVAGARSIRSMTADGRLATFAIRAGEGRYRDFLDGLVLSATAAAG